MNNNNFSYVCVGTTKLTWNSEESILQTIDIVDNRVKGKTNPFKLVGDLYVNLIPIYLEEEVDLAFEDMGVESKKLFEFVRTLRRDFMYRNVRGCSKLKLGHNKSWVISGKNGKVLGHLKISESKVSIQVDRAPTIFDIGNLDLYRTYWVLYDFLLRRGVILERDFELSSIADLRVIKSQGDLFSALSEVYSGVPEILEPSKEKLIVISLTELEARIDLCNGFSDTSVVEIVDTIRSLVNLRPISNNLRASCDPDSIRKMHENIEDLCFCSSASGVDKIHISPKVLEYILRYSSDWTEYNILRFMEPLNRYLSVSIEDTLNVNKIENFIDEYCVWNFERLNDYVQKYIDTMCLSPITGTKTMHSIYQNLKQLDKESVYHKNNARKLPICIYISEIVNKIVCDFYSLEYKLQLN